MVVNVFMIVTALALTRIVQDGGTPGDVTTALFIAFFYAVVAGIIWARLLTWLQGQPFSSMLTLGAILLLYALAEFVGANGAMTIFLFGLLLGNVQGLIRRLAGPLRRVIGYELDQAQFALDTFLKRLNEELSFLVRTFFYVLLGLMLELSMLTWAVAGTGFALFLVGLAARALVFELFARV